ncbi:RNA polymerase ii-associated protein 3-like [Plakobranchus ocellatus]|uniref:RNA polymerase ii-associated protein 3-like n=1 Tax=Plakobranchus ocellatus TaxID=259542 RepID=A0AAV4CLM1_9GAST|nr:RNA polymerase ii-associated protein 3-like [Plakobranchus ocellatus]
MSISSHEEKMLNLQHQLRQNQSELQSYLAGLDDWETEIKEKEQKLKSGDSENKAAALPPVRNTIEKKKMKKKKKEKQVDPNKPKRISGFDFRAWDKFDVDKALEDIDGKEEKVDTSSSDYETDEEWEMERKKHLAELEKDKGNKFLKNGDSERAVEAYTKGMELDATNSILPANRALALIKQQKFGAAEIDCTTSIVLDPLYVKAYLRRATARAGLGRVKDAMEDYGRVLDLEPANKQAKTELERLEKELIREKEGPIQSSYTEGQRGIVKPVYKSPEERSKMLFVGVAIENALVSWSPRQCHTWFRRSKEIVAKACLSSILTDKSLDNCIFENLEGELFAQRFLWGIILNFV